MKTFDEEVKQIKNKRILLGILVLVIALIILVIGIIEILPKDINYGEFKKDEKTSKYAKTTIYYLMGPIVKVKDKKTDNVLGYYIAVGEDKNLFIIRLNENNIGIPILGKDIEEATDNLEGIEVKGSVELISSSLREALNNSLNKILDTNIANNSNSEKVLGGYYLETVPSKDNNALRLLVLSIFFAIIGVLYLLINKRIKKNVNMTLQELEEKGILDKVIEEFNSEQLIEYRKVKVCLSPNYIFSYSIGFDIIPFKDIKEVSISKKELGSYNKNKYIIIGTKDNKEYYIAPMKNRRQKAIFNELLAKIKSIIE